MNWWLEYSTGVAIGYFFNKTFEEIMQIAFDYCTTASSIVYVYNGENVRVAAQTLRGRIPTFPAKQGSSCPN